MKKYYKNNFNHTKRVLTDELIMKLGQYLYQFEGVTSVFIDLEFKDGTEINVLKNPSTESVESMMTEQAEDEEEFNPRKYFKD